MSDGLQSHDVHHTHFEACGTDDRAVTPPNSSRQSIKLNHPNLPSPPPCGVFDHLNSGRMYAQEAESVAHEEVDGSQHNLAHERNLTHDCDLARDLTHDHSFEHERNLREEVKAERSRNLTHDRDLARDLTHDHSFEHERNLREELKAERSEVGVFRSEVHAMQVEAQRDLSNEKERAISREQELKHECGVLRLENELMQSNCDIHKRKVRDLETSLAEAMRQCELAVADRAELAQLREKLMPETEQYVSQEHANRINEVVEASVDNKCVSMLEFERLNTELRKQQGKLVELEKLNAGLEFQRDSKAQVDKHLQGICDNQSTLLRKLEGELEQTQRDLVLEREFVCRLLLEIQQLQLELRGEKERGSSQETKLRKASEEIEKQQVANTNHVQEIERLNMQVQMCFETDNTIRDKFLEQSCLPTKEDYALRERQQTELEHNQTLTLRRLEVALDLAQSDLNTRDNEAAEHEVELRKVNAELRYEKERRTALELQLAEQTAVVKKLESASHQADLSLSHQRTELQLVTQERDELQKKRDEKQKLVLELQQKIEIQAQKAKRDEHTFLMQVEEALEEAVGQIECEKLLAAEVLADTLHLHADHETVANKTVY